MNQVRICQTELFNESVADCASDLEKVIPGLIDTYGGEAILCALAHHLGEAIRAARKHGVSDTVLIGVVDLVEHTGFRTEVRP